MQLSEACGTLSGTEVDLEQLEQVADAARITQVTLCARVTALPRGQCAENLVRAAAQAVPDRGERAGQELCLQASGT